VAYGEYVKSLRELRLATAMKQIEVLGVQTHYHVAEQLDGANTDFLLAQLTEIYTIAMDALPEDE